MNNETTQAADINEEPLPQAVQDAAPGEFVVLPDEYKANEIIVWRDRNYAGVIFDESAYNLNRGSFAAWSPKAGTRNGVVGFFDTVDEAADAIKALYAPAEASAPVPAGRTFTVVYTGAGEPIVHAEGCSHNVRDSLRGAHSTESVTGTLNDVASRVYADMLEEDDSMTPADYVGHLNIKPCAR